MSDYSELAKKLRERAGCFDYDGRPDIACDYEQAADAIEQLQKDLERSKDFESFWQHEAEEALKNFQVAVSNKPRWIPVTERLPDSGQSCLCYYNGGQFGEMSWISLDRYIDWDGCSGFYPFHKDELIGTVTHWMPLPEPPKEDA